MLLKNINTTTFYSVIISNVDIMTKLVNAGIKQEELSEKFRNLYQFTVVKPLKLREELNLFHTLYHL